jgi:peptidoglycan/xylan/chitin deacetylase (PgdA/CDA1 family)
MGDFQLALSIDLDEWYHSSRWIDGRQRHAVPDMPALFQSIYGKSTPGGDVIEPTRLILDLLDRSGCRCTFFVLGEMAQWYPDLVRELASCGHEIGCHGLHHVDMTVLGPDRFRQELETASEILAQLAGARPRGYRAPNLVYEPWATKILEQSAYEYDSTVCVSRPIGGKYKGWSGAPLHPYHPAYDRIAEPGTAHLIEVPLPPFPVLRVSAGSSIFTRALGYQWSSVALRSALRTGHTAYYLHPWELAPVPANASVSLRSRLLYRRTGPWMVETFKRLLQDFKGRIVPVGECVRIVREEEGTGARGVSPIAAPRI